MVDTQSDSLQLSPRVVARLSWGIGDLDVPLRDVAEPALGSRADSRGGRPLRPLPRLRPDQSARVTVLVDDDPGGALRFVIIGPAADTQSVLLDTEPPPPAGRVVVDFVPDNSGGVFLLEFIAGDEPTNRLRRLDADGSTRWSRTGPVDHRNSDPAGLSGIFLSLHLTDTGELWLVPRSTTSGLAAFDSASGRSLDVRPLDADVANPVVSAQGSAYYGRLLDADNDDPHPLLATTELRSGETSYVDYGRVPLLQLAGVDGTGRVYARSPDGVICLRPDGTSNPMLRFAGAVVAQDGRHITTAEPVDQENSTVTVSEFGSDGGHRQWLIPIDASLATGRMILVDVVNGPLFVFQSAGSSRRPGKLLILDAKGSQTHPALTGDQAAAELDRRESRTDPAQFVVDNRGALYLPVSDPHGCSVLCWAPVET